MLWFEKNRVPPGVWPFLSATYNGLREIKATLSNEIDLTEGQETITTTGCMRVYRQAAMRCVLDLAQSAILAWNAELLIGAVVSSRSLLERIATYHAFLRRAEALATASDWETLGKLVDAYAFSTSSGRGKKKKPPEHPPRISEVVKEFVQSTEPGKEQFWEQICDTAHPNGKRMLMYAGTLADGKFIARTAADNQDSLFVPVYNALHSCCWLIASDTDFEILLERIRTGEELPVDHHPIQEKNLIEDVVRKSSPKSARCTLARRGKIELNRRESGRVKLWQLTILVQQRIEPYSG